MSSRESSWRQCLTHKQGEVKKETLNHREDQAAESDYFCHYGLMGTGEYSLWEWATGSQAACGCMWNPASAHLALWPEHAVFGELLAWVEVLNLFRRGKYIWIQSFIVFLPLFPDRVVSLPDSSSKTSPTDGSSPQSVPPTERRKQNGRKTIKINP